MNAGITMTDIRIYFGFYFIHFDTIVNIKYSKYRDSKY